MNYSKKFKLFFYFIVSTFLTYSIQNTTAQSWSEITVSITTSQNIAGCAGFYDNLNNRMVIFGGVTYSGYTNNIWLLNYANGFGGIPNWQEITTSGIKPINRYGHSAVYDPTSNRMTIFGGYGGSSGLLNDVWVLTNANGLGGALSWIQLTTLGSGPSKRVSHTSAYDTVNNRMIVFGGNTGSFDNQLWVLEYATGLGGTPSWSQLTISGFLPSGRSASSGIFDQSNNRFVVFGGYTGNNYNSNETWVLENANGLGGLPTWTLLTVIGNIPGGRAAQNVVYDSILNRVMLFAGSTTSQGDYQDTWVLVNSNGLGGSPYWTELITGGSIPSKRCLYSDFYDPTNNLIIVHGGIDNNSNFLNDTWVLTMANGVPVELSDFTVLNE